MVKRIFITVTVVIGFGFSSNVFGQKPVTIKLDNPSFEDFPQAANTPKDWFDCGFAGESAPDVQPNSLYKVTKSAFSGSTYLGMVVRDNYTWEAVGQLLKAPLLKDTKYSFSLHLCRSDSYLSISQLTKADANYVTPVIIRIWSGSGYCAKEELLAESKVVSSLNWEKYNFIFKPKANYGYFMIESYYKIPTLFPYNGNILIDNASAIVPILDKN
jgi:hypothetical protein